MRAVRKCGWGRGRHLAMIALMQPPTPTPATPQTKLDFLGPIARQRLRDDFPAGFAVSRLFPSQSFSRLAEAEIALLTPVEASVQYDGKDRLRLAMHTRARLACARCLQPLDLPVQSECRFRLFETVAQADKALDVSDAEEAVCDDDQVSLLDLLEDEVLMRLSDPYVHPDCQAPADLSASGQRPFAGLDQLLSAKTSPKKS